MDREKFEHEQDTRRARRMQEELGLDAEDVELVLRLRRQLVELQTRVRELEIQLAGHTRRRAARIATYQVYYEATWREVGESEEEQDANGLG